MTAPHTASTSTQPFKLIESTRSILDFFKAKMLEQTVDPGTGASKEYDGISHIIYTEKEFTPEEVEVICVFMNLLQLPPTKPVAQNLHFYTREFVRGENREKYKRLCATSAEQQSPSTENKVGKHLILTENAINRAFNAIQENLPKLLRSVYSNIQKETLDGKEYYTYQVQERPTTPEQKNMVVFQVANFPQMENNPRILRTHYRPDTQPGMWEVKVPADLLPAMLETVGLQMEGMGYFGGRHGQGRPPEDKIRNLP